MMERISDEVLFVCPCGAELQIVDGMAESCSECGAAQVVLYSQGGHRSGRRGKYNNQHTRIDGYTFDSKSEAQYYLLLKSRAQAGEIHGLQVHPVYVLVDEFTDRHGQKHGQITYEADFSYVEDGREIVVDVKGVQTAVFKIKRTLFCQRYQMKLILVDA